MAYDYLALRNGSVEPLLAQFGTSGTLHVNVAATGDPWDSQLGGEDTHPITVVRTKFTQTDNQGTLVEANDVMFLVSTEGVTIDPELAHRITVDGVAYQVVRVDPLRPGPTTMLWKVHARK